MSDTPRTDAEASDGWSGDVLCVSEDFARTLERELAAAIRERDTAKRRANKIAAETLVVTEQRDQLAGALLKAEKHLDKEYSHTVANEESDTVEDAGWVLLCEIRAALAMVERREA